MVEFKLILEQVAFLRGIVEDWQRAVPPAVPLVEWRGAQRKAVSEEVQQAAAELFELVATQAIEDTITCRRLVLTIDEFDTAFCDWAEKCQQNPDRTDPSGTPDVWSKYQQMIDAMLPRQFPIPEPIGAMLALKPPVSVRQIAKTYGWYLPNGEPDTSKVQEEITTPGKHFNPATWIHPGLARLKVETDMLWESRGQKATNGRPQLAASKSEPKKPREAPESLDELIRHGINGKQIAKMKRLTEEQVRARAAEMGIPLDGNLLSAFYRQTKTQDEEETIKDQAEAMRIAGINSHEQLGDDLTARVLAMSSDGRKPKDIVAALATAFPGLNHQRVAKIRDEAKRTPATAGG